VCVCRYMALGIALRYVLEALKQSPGKKMYMFGLTALDKFKTRSAIILADFTFWISLSLRPSPSPKYGLRPKISEK